MNRRGLGRVGAAFAVLACAGAAAQPIDTPAMVRTLAPGGARRLELPIPFAPASARLQPQSSALLADLVAALQSPELRATRFVIEGHSDASGAPALNQQLSQERADEVRQYLVALGVSPARLRAVGKGASVPARADDPRARENRRVVVVALD